MPRNNSKQRREQRRQRITNPVITNPVITNADELNKQLSEFLPLLFAEAGDGHLYYFGEHSPFCQCHLERALREQAKGAS